MDKINNNIKQMIDRSGLKQTYIADSLGFHPADISHWVSGRRIMRKAVCKDMATLLNCRMSDLYPSQYKDTNKHKHLPLTIANLLDFLKVDYNSEWMMDRLESYDLGLDSEINDRKFGKLRLKYKGVK